MAFVYLSADELIDKPPGDGASAVEMLEDAIQERTGASARSRKQGAALMERPSLARGTAIARFNADGSYAGGNANFLSHTSCGMWVLDRHRIKDRITRRHIDLPRHRAMDQGSTWHDASNNALAFSVIER